MKKLALLALTLPYLASAAPTAPETTPPQTVALLAAIGDRIEMVRQLKLSSGRSEPYRRATLQISNQRLNFAVLRGMDKALTEEEPQAQHVLLQWSMPEDLAKQLEKTPGRDREDLVMNAVIAHLRDMPERQGWDRIEVIVPAYGDLERQGVGSRLSGIGVYFQPLAPQTFDMDGIADGSTNGGVITSESEGDYKTVNPKTGETSHEATYVAPYMYFERLTYDAKTLALLKRQSFFDNTKYADPDSTAWDVTAQMSTAELTGKLLQTVERSAYKSIHQVTSEVTTTEPKLVTPPAPPAPSASSPR